VLGNPVKLVDLDGHEPVNADRILTELATWAQSLGAHHKKRVDSIALHAILNTELPKAVGMSPRLITEAVIDQEGKIVAHGKGPQVPGRYPKGTFQTIDVLVIEDHVSAKEVDLIRRGELSAKGKVVPVDLKLGGATMTRKVSNALKARLGARPVLVGQHGRFNRSRKTLQRALKATAEAMGDAAKYAKWLAKYGGKAVRPLGIAMDVKQFVQDPTIETGSSIAGSAAGAAAGTKIGATLGAPLGPVGVVVGGIIGGIVGGIVGSEAGREFGKGLKFALETAKKSPGSFVAPGTGSFVFRGGYRGLLRFPGQK
jgi:hypothetical protein